MNEHDKLNSPRLRNLLQEYAPQKKKESLLEVLQSERELIIKCLKDGMSGKELHSMLRQANVHVCYTFFMNALKRFKEIEGLSNNSSAPVYETTQKKKR